MFFAITPTDRREWPRCTDCGRTAHIAATREPRSHVCNGCGAELEVSRTYAGAWSVRRIAAPGNALEVADAAACA